MPLPDNWAFIGSRPVWDVSNGWQAEHTYKGPANESDIQAIVDAVSEGATKLTLDKTVYARTIGDTEYAYIITLTATYAATGPTGGVRPPSDPEYGLFSRTWELTFETRYLNLTATPQAEALATFDPEWPAMIDLVAADYRRVLQEWQEAYLTDEQAAKPDIASYRAVAQYPVRAGASADLGTLAGWMFDRLVADPDAAGMDQSPVLSKTEIVSGTAAIRASHANSLRVFSWGTLLNAETSLEGAILLSTADLATQSPYWLKHRPRVEVTSQGKFTISQQYTGLAGYDGIQYGPAL
jgi:hypothetical protein